MIKRNKTIAKLLTIAMSTSLINTGVAFANVEGSIKVESGMAESKSTVKAINNLNSTTDFSVEENYSDVLGEATTLASPSPVPVTWESADSLTSAKNVTINGIEFAITDSVNNYVSVKGYTDEMASELVLPSEITCGSTTYTVTSIGNSAFYKCSGLTSIEIPSSVTIIGEHVFDENSVTVLLYQDLNNEITITGIYHNKIMPEVTIPDTICGIEVTDIADDLFKGCTGITSITCYKPDIKAKISTQLSGVKIQIGISAKGFSGKFDGKVHSITVNGAPEGSTIKYSTSETGEYTTVNPSYKDKGTYTVYYKVTNSNYERKYLKGFKSKSR